VAAGSAADGRLVAEVGRRTVTSEDGSVRLVPEIEYRVGILSWAPRTPGAEEHDESRRHASTAREAFPTPDPG